MSALVLALLLGPVCEEAEAAGLSAEQAATLCALEARPEGGPAPASTEALTALYERPEFKAAHGGQAGDLFKRLKAWLEALFETTGAETYSNVTRVVVLILAAFVVIAVVSRFAGRRRSARVAAAAPATTALALADPEAHLARARALSTNDPRASAREGLLAILSALERQRLARPDRVKTNRELARELPARGAPPELVEAVATQLAWFDAAWYSLEPLDAPRVTAFLEAAAALVARLTAFGAGAPAR